MKKEKRRTKEKKKDFFQQHSRQNQTQTNKQISTMT
jgi:hypothetical protein